MQKWLNVHGPCSPPDEFKPSTREVGTHLIDIIPPEKHTRKKTIRLADAYGLRQP